MSYPDEWYIKGHPYSRQLESEGRVIPGWTWYDDRVEFSGFHHEEHTLKIRVNIRGDEATQRVYRVDKSRWETVKVGRRKERRCPEETVSEQVVNWRERVGTGRP